MRPFRVRKNTCVRVACLALWLAACSAADGGEPLSNFGLVEASDLTSAESAVGVTLGTASQALRAEPQALDFRTRSAACAQDPRVTAGLVSQQICAGASVFFEETFEGNGRTCGSCHPAANNTTLDQPFVEALHRANPDDPLFIFERDDALAELETDDLLNAAAILENVDGFEAPTTKFVSRGVTHVLSISTSIAPDTGDGTTNPPTERAGWGGDGAEDGTLKGFLAEAVKQHFTKSLARIPNEDFRTPTPDEAEAVLQFQRSLGRLNELNLQNVRLFDAGAEEGRRAFLAPERGRCNFCHSNAGANSQLSGKNRNFDSGTRSVFSSLTRGTFNGEILEDGGFGGRGLDAPDLEGRAFGNGTFSPPPLIEAADTPPFFHNNLKILSGGAQNLEDAIAFYGQGGFKGSPGAAETTAFFGTPPDLQTADAGDITRFLRTLNGAFNIDIARQRLNAARTLVQRFGNAQADVQLGLLELARVEIDDAVEVFDSMYPVATERLAAARDEINLGLAASTAAQRANRIDNAISGVLNARDQVGDNITFQLGQGNLMF
jgi:cytochrome c peroxidase